MINLIIDTNIYTKNPRREDFDFKALEKLGKAHKILLYIPYIVEREFQTQQFLKSKGHIDAVISNLDSMLRNNLTVSTTKLIEKVFIKFRENYQIMLSESEQVFSNWATSINAKRIPLSQQQTKKAWEAYFKGKPPFKEPKIRKDIPDSFVVQSIEEVLHKLDLLYLVCEDGKIRDTFKENTKVLLFNSLNEFIQHNAVQEELRKLDFIDTLESIQKSIQSYEEDSRFLEYYIQTNLGDKIIDKEIEDYRIPDDNNMATISSYYDPEFISINMKDISYYGDGILGFDFTATLRVSIYYYIYKADYYGLPDEISPSVTDHNDHYFEAEDECEIQVKGTIGINFDYKNLCKEEIEESFDIENLEVEAIEFIGW